MTILEQHELLELEVLEKLKNNRLLKPVVFGGGTMLRLCYGLDRYSVDLDFWIIKQISPDNYYNRILEVLRHAYEITDTQHKFYSLLFELRSKNYPKRLKIEIRKEIKNCDFQDKIAFSPNSTKQVVLRTHTLKQTMENKIQALLNRKEIRDSFDIEFLLKHGIQLPELHKSEFDKLFKILSGFRDNDYKVKLGSILEKDTRAFYISDKFSLLKQRLNLKLNE